MKNRTMFHLLKTICLTILIIFNFQTVFSQEIVYKAYNNGVMMEEINYHDYKKVDHPEIERFVGNYSFGDSESETTLEIIYSNGKLYARDVWYRIGGEEVFVEIKKIPITFKNGMILGSYELYICIEDSFSHKKGDIGIGRASNDIENGVRIHSLEFHEKRAEIKIDGTYPELSFVKLEKKELQTYSKRELQIMRNEIFARNGHIFRQYGDMDIHFSEQPWYKKIGKVSHNDLSDIENHNIKIIKSLE